MPLGVFWNHTPHMEVCWKIGWNQKPYTVNAVFAQQTLLSLWNRVLDALWFRSHVSVWYILLEYNSFFMCKWGYRTESENGFVPVLGQVRARQRLRRLRKKNGCWHCSETQQKVSHHYYKNFEREIYILYCEDYVWYKFYSQIHSFAIICK